MPDRIDQREAIAEALREFDVAPLPVAARQFFNTLGYSSDRTTSVATTKAFITNFDPSEKLTDREKEQLGRLTKLHFLFQLTDTELTSQSDLLSDPSLVENTRIYSYLFFAVELPPGAYTRTELSAIARAINKPLPMPALVLLRHGDAVSLAIIHRRLSKRDQSRDVREKATLVKDIRIGDPIRAHLEILNDFAFANLDADFGISNFVSLHTAWQKRLDSYALNERFYREIADWYFWAHHLTEDGTISLPRHCDTEGEKSLFLIRLLTRLIFCWFLVEKRLLPAELFRGQALQKLLKNVASSTPTYYHAVLQNLFFGTLNMPIEQRGFREKKKEGERYDKNRGITNLWRYGSLFRDYDKDSNTSSAWEALAEKVPFLNGGLFDCLDDKTGRKTDNFILDGFSDNPNESCHLPNDLFFGAERVVDLSKDYGEEDKRTARSKRAKVRGLIETLSRYKFTIEENTPLEEEIALDPELLGKVFENLLASYNEDTRTTARKALGAFYTPREIVSYMVDESLRSYLSTQVPGVSERNLRDLFSNKATPPEIKPTQREALVAAIGRVKILDPACGSGAFPMGALHRLVDLLQKLDPNNESWKRDRLAEARRYRQLLEEAGASKEEIADCDARIDDIEKSFNTRFHALDFARKLYLIENCIYGVDIQPVAVQIAKLRFFISLVVDQKIDLKAENIGVRPLPNLETRLVAADSTMPIDRATSDGHIGDLFSGELVSLRADLARIRHEHFNSRDPSNKLKWREADAAKRLQIAELLQREHALAKDAAVKLATWDPYDQNAFAPFFDAEWMFGFPVGKVQVQGKAPATLLGNLALINEVIGQNELTGANLSVIDSGFDVVIGNPPYVRIQTLAKKDPHLVEFYKTEYSSAAKGNYDLYVVFIEAGLRLLKSDGHLAYICPHKFFNQQYGEPLRKLIAEGHHLRHIVHFGDEQVFSGAAIYTCLIFLSKLPSPECRFVRVSNLDSWKITLAGVEGLFVAEGIRSEEWNFVTGKGRSVFETLVAFEKQLADIARIWQGIVTSADKLFVLREVAVSGNDFVIVEDREGAEWKLETTLAKPALMDVSINRYVSHSPTHRIIVPYRLDGKAQILLSPSEVESLAPKVWKYLKHHESMLRARESGKANTEAWYGYIYPKNLALFDAEKLIVQVMAKEPRFAFDPVKVFFTGGGNGPYYGLRLTKNNERDRLLALQAVLNSKITDFFIRQTSTTFRGDYWSYGKQFIERIPIANSTRAQESTLSLLVEYLLCLNLAFLNASTVQTTRDPLMVAYYEQILNGLVYELYFSEEVHHAGISIFDLVTETSMPALNAMSGTRHLSHFRQTFETLYDGACPLKIALQKLQTLDVVRVIEGKD